MGMPDGWERLSYLQEGWCKGNCTVIRTEGRYNWFTETSWDYSWFEYGKQLRHGGFPDPVSCAVACELATGGCTDGHA